MKNKRLLCCVVSALCLLFALSGAQAKQVTLTFWENAVADRFSAAEEIIAEFEKQNPDIKVEILPLQDSERVNKLTVAVAGGQGPDVVAFWGAEFKRLAIEGMWLDIEPYVKRYMTQRDLNDFFPGQMEFFRVGSMRYALPQYAGTVATFVNKTMFDEAGVVLPKGDWNLNDFVNLGRKLTVDTTGDGAPDKYGFVFLRFQDRIGMSIKRAGGSMLIKNDMRSFGLDTPESIAALEWLQSLMYTNVIAPRGTESKWRMQSGNVGMEENGPWQIAGVKLYEVPFELNVVEPPRGPNGPVSYLSSDGYAIVRDTKHPDEAFKLLQFLASPYAMEVRAKVAGLQPSRRSVARTWLEAMPRRFPALANANWMTFFQVAEYAETEPYFHRYSEVWSLLSPALNKIWAGTPPSNAIGEVAEAIRSVLKK